MGRIHMTSYWECHSAWNNMLYGLSRPVQKTKRFFRDSGNVGTIKLRLISEMQALGRW